MKLFFFNFFAILSISFASLSDSQLISKIFLFIAISSSSSVLPTPEKTILFDLMPAFKFRDQPKKAAPGKKRVEREAEAAAKAEAAKAAAEVAEAEVAEVPAAEAPEAEVAKEEKS